jgi:hypothetical protein
MKLIPVNSVYPRFDRVIDNGSFLYNTIEEIGGDTCKRPLRTKILYVVVDGPAVRIIVSPFVEPGVRNPVLDLSIVTTGVPLPVKNAR